MQNGQVVDLAEFEVPAPAPLEAEPAKPSVVTSEDRLRVENLQLRLEKAQLEITLTTSQLNERVKVRGDLLRAAESLRQEMMGKYGIDLYAGRINDDGTFVMNPGQRPIGS